MIARVLDLVRPLESGLYALLNYFVDLCLLRAAPQALPTSALLLRLMFVVNVLVGLLLIAGERSSPAMALAESLVEVGLALVALRLALGLRGLAARFNQSATAVMGSSSLIGLVALPLIGLGGDQGGELAVLGAFLLLMLVLWSMVVLGHILRHAFGLALGQGIALSVAYTMASYVVIASLFPV